MPAEIGEPRVAVVMTTRDRRDDALRTLARLAELHERPAVTVVDNGSSDGTADAIAKTFPQVEVIALHADLGAAGLNLGVLHTQARYVAFCDDGSWWEPGSLARAADLFDGH